MIYLNRAYVFNQFLVMSVHHASNLNPSSVTVAVSDPQFYKQRKTFWQMLAYLFADYQGQKVHNFLTPDTFRKICVQLCSLVDAESDFAVIESNAQLLYHVYFLLLRNIRAQKSMTLMITQERRATLTALYNLYKWLRELRSKSVNDEKWPMPQFGEE